MGEFHHWVVRDLLFPSQYPPKFLLLVLGQIPLHEPPLGISPILHHPLHLPIPKPARRAIVRIKHKLQSLSVKGLGKRIELFSGEVLGVLGEEGKEGGEGPVVVQEELAEAPEEVE